MDRSTAYYRADLIYIETVNRRNKMNKKIISINDFNFREEVSDPFIIRMHHVDHYPKSNGNMGVSNEDLKGKNIGNDFDFSSDFKMYYGEEVPGFPVHPHRGFETVTFVLQGFVDHSDSHGATGRYGAGDVQWMTAGRGMQHAEMFPLLDDEKKNTTELFQIWLNLPSKSKFVEPSYKMLWAEDIPVIEDKDKDGNTATITLVTGSYRGVNSLDPNPDSWANDRDNHVGIWKIHLEANASVILPSISSTLNRHLYLYDGGSIFIDVTEIESKSSMVLAGDQDIKIKAGDSEAYLLLLEGEPINEPVFNIGPFVMNSKEEIEKAYKDYRETEFGGWPYKRRDPVNDKEKGRFAKY